MKKITTTFILIFCVSLSFSQDKNPVLSINGVEPVVVEVPNKSAQEIYKNVKKWVIKSYKNPEKVLKVDLPAEQIRINGYNSSFFQGKALGMVDYGVDYMLTIDIKENKYKFSITLGSITFDGGTPYMGTTRGWFKKKDGSVKKYAQLNFDTTNQTLKSLNTAIFNAANGTTQKISDDW